MEAARSTESLQPPTVAERPSVRARSFDDRRTVLLWTVLAVGLGAALTVAQLWAPLVLAAWAAILVRPLHSWLSRQVRGRSRAAGVVTVVLVLGVLTPLVFIALSLVGSATELVARLQSTGDGREALDAFLSSDTTQLGVERGDAQQVIALLQRHSVGATDAVRTLFGAVTTFAVGLFVFVFGFYTFLVDGQRGYQWLLAHCPLEPAHLTRMAAAFEETGRGMLISLGLTSLAQGTLTTVGYLIIGVPQALVLGLLVSIGSFIPIVGTALVWVPVTIALLVTHQAGAAVATAVLGLVVSLLDNFIRPALSRYGQLALPTFVVFVAMLGGVAAFGPGGLLLGPLSVRLTIEGLRIWRDQPAAPSRVS